MIDQGLGLIRTLWDAGIAHRDIKPGNLMVRSGELLLIDVAFVQVRPSPWRQAVDLGNMMLVLAVRTDPETVYRRALRYFTPDELSEAFAATRGVASPTQLRAFMKRDPRDLLGEFRALAPARPPIVLQRWSMRRIALTAALLAVTALAVNVGVRAFFPVGNLGASAPRCGTGHSMILAAQAVPSAAMLPCIAALPTGWSIGGADISSGKVSLWLDSDRAGPGAITVTLTTACDTSGAQQIPSDQPGARRFERPLSLRRQFTGLRFYTFPGGCATYRFAFAPGASSLLALPVTARCHSSPGRRSSSSSGTPKASPYADEVPHAHHEPGGPPRRGEQRLLAARFARHGRYRRNGCHGWMPTGHKAARERLERTAVTRRTGRSGARSITSPSASITANGESRFNRSSAGQRGARNSWTDALFGP